MKRPNILITICVAIVSAYTYQAKAQVNDAQLWTSVAIEKKISNRFTAALSQEFRLYENITELGSFFTDIGLTYKIHKNWKVSANYRFANKRRLDNSYSIRHRYYFDLSYRKKIYLFTLSVRERFQSQYQDVNSSETGHIPSYYSRTKLSLKYAVTKKISPYFFTEMFIPLNNKEVKGIDNMRYSLGVEYEFVKNSTLDVFYLIQQEYKVANPERDFVIGIGYIFSF